MARIETIIDTTGEEYMRMIGTDIPDVNPNEINDDLEEHTFRGNICSYIVFMFFGIVITVGIFFEHFIAMAFLVTLTIAFWLIPIMMAIETRMRRVRIIRENQYVPGVITHISGKKCVSTGGRHGPHTSYYYTVIIKYMERNRITGEDAIQEYRKSFSYNPAKYIENPYCNVYKGMEGCIVKDFKVKNK